MPTDKEIIAIAGTGAGGNAGIVVKLVRMNDFFNLEIRKIIAKPRQKR